VGLFRPDAAGVKRPHRTLLGAARRAGIPVGHPCRGAGVCGRCTVEVVRGAALLPAPTPGEARLLLRERLGPEARIACQVEAPREGELTLRVGGGTWTVTLAGVPEDEPAGEDGLRR
jgi:ferredoxin